MRYGKIVTQLHLIISELCAFESQNKRPSLICQYPICHRVINPVGKYIAYSQICSGT